MQRGKLSSVSESDNFPSLIECVSARGKPRADSLAVLVCERKIARIFSFIQNCAAINTIFYSNTKKVFFKYLNYVLKHSVFVFIFFSRETFFIDFPSSRLPFFSFLERL